MVQCEVQPILPSQPANLPEMSFSGYEWVGDDARYQILEAIHIKAPLDTALNERRLENEIYRATDWEGNKDVAFKVFHPHTEEARRRVEREIDIHERFGGLDSIMPAIDSGVTDIHDQPRPYLAMPYKPSGTLLDQERKHPRSIDMSLSWASEIIPALGILHKAGLVHLDVKPENIMAADGGEHWELTDFGIVEPIHRATNDLNLQQRAATSILETETLAYSNVRGTTGFIAPECFAKDEVVGPSADIYAVGVTLFHGLTGELPHKASTLQEYIESVVNESPVSVYACNRAVPQQLNIAIMACLETDPRNRPSGAELPKMLAEV